jgi:hypothetical protein
VTRVDRLDKDGRVEEVARMIGGASVTEQVRASARELLDAGSKMTRPTQGERQKAKAKVRGLSKNS